MNLAQEHDLAATVKRAQVGDVEAFEVIYQRFADPLFRYLYARCGDQGAAEDLTADLWVRVVERLPNFRFPPGNPEAAFAGWLYQIARNMVTDWHRRRGNSLLPLVAADLLSDGSSPDEHVIKQEERQDLRTAIEQLNPQQREVLVLRFAEKRSNAEVAQLTGRSEGAVKVMQHRALEALARTLGITRRGKERE